MASVISKRIWYLWIWYLSLLVFIKSTIIAKPAELLLQNKDIDINFMFIWDNLTWKRTWSKLSRGLDWAPNYDKSTEDLENIDSGILAELVYGTEDDWKKHYNYLLPFLRMKDI